MLWEFLRRNAQYQANFELVRAGVKYSRNFRVAAKSWTDAFSGSAKAPAVFQPDMFAGRLLERT